MQRDSITAFIDRWPRSGGAEQANYQLFFSELCDLLEVPRLVALNHDRAEEERRGIIRYLRPEFQNPTGERSIPLPLREGPGEGSEPATKKKKAEKPTKRTWPKHLSEQAAAVGAVLTQLATAATANEVAKHFGRATSQRTDRIEEILETLAALGKARELADGRYAAV